MKEDSSAEILTLSQPAQKMLARWSSVPDFLEGDEDALEELAIDVITWLAKCVSRQNREVPDFSLQEGVAEALSFLSSKNRRWKDVQSCGFERSSDDKARSILEMAFLLNDFEVAKELLPSKLALEKMEHLLELLIKESYVLRVSNLTERLEYMHELGWEPNPEDQNFSTVLHKAARSPCIAFDQFKQIVEFLESKGAIDSIMSKLENDAYTPLACSLHAGDPMSPLSIAKINLLLDHGADPALEQGYAGSDFLFLLSEHAEDAIAEGTYNEYCKIIKRIIEMGVDPTHKNKNRVSAMDEAERCPNFQAALMACITPVITKPVKKTNRRI